MTLRRPEIQLAVHLPATGIYLGPKDRADAVTSWEDENAHKGIAESTYTPSPLSHESFSHLRSFFLRAADNPERRNRRDDVPNIPGYGTCRRAERRNRTVGSAPALAGSNFAIFLLDFVIFALLFASAK